ncbi:MAG: InlB B-repeat-containing protein [Alkalimonas sp.]|nr:InlB B-repeat-containing protein [Alkalimonas sp.]
MDSAHAVFSYLNRASLTNRYATVGQLSSGGALCTANYLGHDGTTAYILTAAHCSAGYGDEPRQIPRSGTFRTSDGRVIASGSGIFHVPTYTHWHQDLAVFALPLQNEPRDYAGNLAKWPVLEDMIPHTELLASGHRFEYVGHGRRGVEGHQISSGRAFGSLRLTRVQEKGNLSFGRNNSATDHGWAAARPGDSGSSVWLDHPLRFTVVGTHAVGNMVGFTGSAAVYNFIDFIREIFPQVRLASQFHTVTAERAVQLRSPEHGDSGPVFYLAGEGVAGPDQGVWHYPSRFTMLQAEVENAVDTTRHFVRLRATRATDCGPTRMNNAAFCGHAGRGELHVVFLASDNPNLPAGQYRGEFTLQSMSWDSMEPLAEFPIWLDLDYQPAEVADLLVRDEQPVQSQPFDAKVSGSVFYTTAGVQQGHWRNRFRAFNRLQVPVKLAQDDSQHLLRLRAQRLSSCGPVRMENAIFCGANHHDGALQLQYLASDNSHLPAGYFQGNFTVDVNGWNAEFQQRLQIAVAIAHQMDMPPHALLPTGRIRFDAAGGDALPDMTAAMHTPVVAPPVAKRAHHRFVGWRPALPEFMPASSYDVVAVWQPEHFILSFDSNGGSAVAGRTLVAGAAITPPAEPSREGYEFIGWSASGWVASGLPTVMPARHSRFTAIWQAQETP